MPSKTNENILLFEYDYSESLRHRKKQQLGFNFPETEPFENQVASI